MTRAFRTTVSIGSKLESRFVEPLWRLEHSIFGGRYAICPSSVEETRRCYRGSEISAIFVESGGELVAARIFSALTDLVAESMGMMVRADHRRRGLANLMCQIAVDVFRWKGTRYVTSWTEVSLTAAEILARWAPFIGTSEELTPLERQLLRAVEKVRGTPPGAFGVRRTVPGYYEMTDGSPGDARFWVHEIPS